MAKAKKQSKNVPADIGAGSNAQPSASGPEAPRAESAQRQAVQAEAGQREANSPAAQTQASDVAHAPRLAKGKSQAKSKAAPVPSGPTIDTAHAVEAAAAMVSSGVNTAAPSGSQKESSSFKQLKESLNKPHSQAIGGLLDKTSGPAGKKSGLPFSPFGKQVGRNQTFGADVNRSGVPRRTGG